jgi:hypothetical protein
MVGPAEGDLLTVGEQLTPARQQDEKRPEAIAAGSSERKSINCDYSALSANFRFYRRGPPTDW